MLISSDGQEAFSTFQNRVTFPRKLELLMARNGLTQQSLGDAVGVSQRAVGKWLAGDSIPGITKALDLAVYFKIPVSVLRDDNAELPLDAAEQRFAEAHASAARYPEDQPKLRQLAFATQLERSHHAMHLRETAKRLREEAGRLDDLADGIHPDNRVRDTITPAVAAKLAESRRLREAQEREEDDEDRSSSRAAGE